MQSGEAGETRAEAGADKFCRALHSVLPSGPTLGRSRADDSLQVYSSAPADEGAWHNTAVPSVHYYDPCSTAEIAETEQD